MDADLSSMHVAASSSSADRESYYEVSLTSLATIDVGQ